MDPYLQMCESGYGRGFININVFLFFYKKEIVTTQQMTREARPPKPNAKLYVRERRDLANGQFYFGCHSFLEEITRELK